MELIDDEVRPVEKIPNMLDDNQTIENEEAGEPEDYEEYDYQCYK
jgi:hypothetical protein